MIFEQATIVDVTDSHLVVESVQQSTCGSCAAKKGCGNGVLAQYMSNTNYFKVSLEDASSIDQYRIGDRVELGIDELALVRASLWLYMVPLFGLMIGAYLGHLQSQSLSILFAATGLVVGGYMSSIHSKRTRNHPKYAPQLVLDEQAIRII